MKINKKLLSIPPYISTSWSNVSALQMKGAALVVSLLDGDSIEIPGLKPETIESVFNMHASVIEQDHLPSTAMPPFAGKVAHPFAHAMLQSHPDNASDSSFRMSFASIDELGSVLQHNPQQADAPDLPPEILQKIAAITKIISPDDVQLLPKPEAHCNCVHCQIARTVMNSSDGALIDVKPSAVEEPVNDEELAFQQWAISQVGQNLFNVTNKLDEKEKYSVFLGSPVGCTCGKEGCEHIIAVLKS